MSKISDELRAAANMLFLSGSNGYNVLIGLADRIDVEKREPIFSGTAYEYIEKFGKEQ